MLAKLRGGGGSVLLGSAEDALPLHCQRHLGDVRHCSSHLLLSLRTRPNTHRKDLHLKER